MKYAFKYLGMDRSASMYFVVMTNDGTYRGQGLSHTWHYYMKTLDGFYKQENSGPIIFDLTKPEPTAQQLFFEMQRLCSHLAFGPTTMEVLFTEDQEREFIDWKLEGIGK